MDSKKFSIAVDPVYGYRHLDPLPTTAETTEFYESRYYDLLRRGNRAPELRRLMQGGPEADRERRWLRETLYTDTIAVLTELGCGKRLLDIGCGTGDFIAFASEHGLSVTGIEASLEAAQCAVARGLRVHTMMFDRFASQFKQSGEPLFEVVVMLNVLEHVPDPVNVVKLCRQILSPGGILCIRVPNDFTEIQDAAQKKVGRNPWWIAAPDHINYFNFESLARLFDGLGFGTVYAQGDFPMEMFLLMGEDYAAKPELGPQCHARRVEFELSMPGQLRRKLYSSLAKSGLGRNCLVFGESR